MYPSRPGGPSRAMQPPQQIDPSLASQQNQGFYSYPQAGQFIHGLSSPSGSESVGTPSDTSFSLKRSSSVVGNIEEGGAGNKRPRKDESSDQVAEKEPKAKSTRGSRYAMFDPDSALAPAFSTDDPFSCIVQGVRELSSSQDEVRRC